MRLVPFILTIALICNYTYGLSVNCGGASLPGLKADSAAFNGGTPRGKSGVGAWAIHTHSYGPSLEYRFRVRANKQCNVVLKFAETYAPNAKVGGRVMSVSIGGEVIRDKLDVYVAAGKKLRSAVTVSRKFIAPGSGIVKVVVRRVSGDSNAMISRIDIWGSDGQASAGYGAAIPGPHISPASTNPPSTPSFPKLTEASKFTLLAPKGSPTARHEACAVLTLGKMYLIGGRGFRPVDVYDLRTNAWVKKRVPSVWVNGKKKFLEMNHFQCVAIGAKIYAVGAWYGSFPYEKPHTVTFVYNTYTDNWSTMPGLGARNRGGGATVVYGNKIFTAGGNVGGHGQHATSVPWFDRLDVNTGKWTKLPNMPQGRDHTGGAVVGNQFCVIGGRNGGVANFWGTPITSINCYNFQKGTWATMKSYLPEGRAGAATGATCDGHIMVAGGEGRKAGTFQGGKAYNRVDIYNPRTDSFVKVLFMKQGRHGSGLCVADCKCGNIYIPSGSGGLGGGPELTSVEVFSPDGKVRPGSQCL